MFDLTTDSILAKASKDEYNAGQWYFRNGRIKSVQYNQEKRSFTSTVLGTRLYNQHLTFTPAGKLSQADCTCFTGDDYQSCCKHIVAVLLLILEKNKQGFFHELRFRQAAKNIFSLFGDRQITVKSPVSLEPTFELEKSGGAGRSLLRSLKLRIGQDKLYVVRDIRKLLYHKENNLEMSFGKKFTYYPSRHEFRGRDLELMNLLQEIYETDKLVTSFATGRTNTGIFRNAKVYLTDSAFKRFLKIYKDSPFHAVILGNKIEAAMIKEEDIPVSFLLSNDGKDLVLSIDFEGSMLPLTEDGEYFYSGNSIYHITKQQSEYLKPFYMAMLYQKGRKLRFIEQDKQRFVSEILPFAEKAGRLVIAEQVRSAIEKLPLEAEVYLDRDGSDLTAEVRFIYGEHIFNPFVPYDKTSASTNKLLIRDIRNEEAILDILGMTDFRVMEGKVRLSGEEAICDFIYRIIPLLQDYASVYYSENLKKINLRASVSFSAHFRLNTDSDMLEFSFDADGIDRTELTDILASVRHKKKYYQLKNGSYINLDSSEFVKLNTLLEKLDIGIRQIEHEFIELPKFRAAYLDQNLRDFGFHNIERNATFKEYVQNIREPGDMAFPLPAGLKGTLRDYQKFGFKWLKTLEYYGLGGILADDMGLGKTLQIIALLLSAKNEKGPAPSLIVVPSSLVFNWCAELDKFAPGLEYITVIGDKEERRRLISSLDRVDAVITSYPLIRRDIELYDAYNFRYCILDEAQQIKNPASRNARSVKRIKAKTRFALTGTPMENNLYELWSVFDFVLPGYLYSYKRFHEKYVQPTSGEDGHEALDDLNRLIKPFVLRRIKKDVLDELPEKIEHTMIAELTEDQKKLYLAYLEDIKGKIDSEINEVGFEKSKIKILAALTRLRQLCCHPSLFIDNYEGESGKMLLLEEIIRESVNGGHRILLFSQYTSMLQIIRKKLEAMKISCLYLDGSTPVSERGYLVNSFNKGSGDIFLISLKAGGTGLNLTGADMVIHYDPWWNPAVEEQATDRSYRIGQKKSVYVIKLITKGTIEEKILALQEKKRNMIDAVIQPGETLLSKMTQEEIRALFE